MPVLKTTSPNAFPRYPKELPSNKVPSARTKNAGFADKEGMKIIQKQKEILGDVLSG